MNRMTLCAAAAAALMVGCTPAPITEQEVTDFLETFSSSQNQGEASIEPFKAGLGEDFMLDPTPPHTLPFHECLEPFNHVHILGSGQLKEHGESHVAKLMQIRVEMEANPFSLSQPHD